MKTLKSNQSAELLKGVKSVFAFLLKQEKTKAEKLKDQLIQKFDKENFELSFNTYVSAQAQNKDVQKEIISSLPVHVPKENNPSNDALSNKDGLSDAEINHDLLKSLGALGISNAIKSSGGKSIFKKEFNNKQDRTKCRNAFQSTLARMLMFTAHNKKDLADKELISLKEIANKYYIAGDSFKNVSDYCTDNMQADKKGLIKLFIDTLNPVSA